jgi:autoinducer 2 (AI-2) kinase
VLTETLGGGFQEVVLTGGAARSRLWPQILADVLGLPVLVPDISEATAAGAAIMAGLAVGAALDDAGPPPAGPSTWVANPVPGGQDTYDVLYRQWVRRRPRADRPE